MTTIPFSSQKRFSFSLFFLLFYLAWTLCTTRLYVWFESFFSTEPARIIFSNLVKMVLWLLQAFVYIIKIDRGNPLGVLRINTPIGLSIRKLLKG